jgi:hypothetical protein
LTSNRFFDDELVDEAAAAATLEAEAEAESPSSTSIFSMNYFFTHQNDEVQW